MANAIPIIDISEDEVVCVHQANSIPSVDNDDDNKHYYAKRVKRDNVIGPWQPCELLELSDTNVNNSKVCIVRFFQDHTKMDVPEYEMAARKIPMPIEIITVGTRIIARRRSDSLPYVIDESNEKVHLLYSNQTHFYPGIIAGIYDQKFMVFFDDGVVQLTKIKYIRRVLGNFTFNYAHSNAKSYFEWFMKQEQRLEVRELNMVGKILNVELNRINEDAKVLKIEYPLALINFEAHNRFEWIYLGSPRIVKVYRKLITLKKLDDLIKFKTFKACLSASDDVVLIDPVDASTSDGTKFERKSNNVVPVTAPVPPTQKYHKCRHECVQLEDKKKVDDYGVLQRPLALGWQRSLDNKGKVVYHTPCGQLLSSIPSVERFLWKTKSNLKLNSFEFNKNCKVILDDTTTAKDTAKSKDISHGIENLPISVCGEMKLKHNFNYINTYKFDFIDEEPANNLGRTGCNCIDDCREKTKCSCFLLTMERMFGPFPSKQEIGKYPDMSYQDMKLQDIVKNGIVECGKNCACCTNRCVNRIVQQGMQYRLEIFETQSKGWGVRSTTDIPSGVFVCKYSGDILDNSSADKRDTMYQFRMPLFPVDAEIDYPGPSEDDSDDSESDAKRPRLSDDVIQPFINYFPLFMQNGNANHFPESEDDQSKDYVIDALNNGSVSRFINHSCDPNLFTQAVYVDEDKRFPQIAFFSSELIKAGEELTIDYNYDLDENPKTPCLCGTSKCRKWFK